MKKYFYKLINKFDKDPRDIYGSITTTDNVYEQIKRLAEKNSSNSQIFEEFNYEVEKIGIKIKYSTIISKLDTHIINPIIKQTEPCLFLFVKNNEEFNKLKMNYSQTALKDKVLNTKIINLWINLCKKYNIDEEYFLPNLMLSIHNVQQIELVNLTYSSKKKSAILFS